MFVKVKRGTAPGEEAPPAALCHALPPGAHSVSGQEGCPNPMQLRKKGFMPDWAWFLIVFVGYIALMRWVLPAMGVTT
jgi:hypothetical protein